MDMQPVFKKALFGGFEKQSVLNCIYDLHNKAKAEHERLSAELEESVAERQRLLAEIEELKNQAKAEHDRLSAELSESVAERQRLLAKIDELEQKLAGCECAR